MSTASTPESLKNKAKVIRKFVKEKYNLDISHGHCLDLVSDLFGFKDWNTASAASKLKADQISLPIEIGEVGELRKVLEMFDDSDIIDAEYVFKIGDLLESLDPMGTEADSIRQEFKLVLDHLDAGEAKPKIVTFKLELEYENLEIAPYSNPPKESCDFWKN
jgi:hypothetical protein